MSDRRSMQVLPDSTGRTILLHHHFKVSYTNLQPGKSFLPGDTVVGASSGLSMLVNMDDVSLSPKTLYGTLPMQQNELSFISGEQLLVDGIHIADTSNTGVSVYVNPVHTVSHDNPFHGQVVDSQGAASVRFSEGSQEFDGIGRSLIAEYTPIAEYSFRYTVTGGGNEGMYVTSSGTGNITHEATTSTGLATTGISAGDYVSATSKVRHLYSYGNSLFSYFVMTLGDPGKTNVRRRWGLFDGNDGFFFESVGNDLYVVSRSSFTGSPVDIRVHQQDWSKDTLDGTKNNNNKSGININIGTINGYWLDINHGVRVRFGVLSPDGGRVVVHDFISANKEFKPGSKSPDLPARAEQENLGAVGSSSEWRVFYIGVGIEGDLDVSSLDTTGNYFAATPVRVSVGAEETPLLSIRPKLTLNGIENHRKAFPNILNLATTGTAGEQFIIRIREDSVLSGDSWSSSSPTSSLEMDTTSSGVSVPGPILYQGYSAVGVSTVDLRDCFRIGGRHIHLLPDYTTQMVYTVTAQAVDSSPGTLNVAASLRWFEV